MFTFYFFREGQKYIYYELKENNDYLLKELYSCQKKVNELERHKKKMDIENIELLKKNQDKINWNNLYKNPAIFTYDYDLIKENKKIREKSKELQKR